MKKQIKQMAAIWLSVFVATFVAGCSDEDNNVVVPDNWVTVATEPLTIGYEGGELTLDYTLAAGLDGAVPYVVNQTNWCSGYIKEGRIVIEVQLSDEINARTAEMSFRYDEAHQVSLTVEQGKAPAVAAEGFNFDNLPESIGIDETCDLARSITVLPTHASYKQLTFAIIEGAELLTIDERGIATGVAPGTATIRVTAPDANGVIGNGVAAEFTLTIEGQIEYDCAAWTITTTLPYTADGTTGKPEDMFDGKTTTFLSLQKPGKGANAAGIVPGFTIDLQKELTFNYFFLAHRSNNTTKGLRLQGAKLYGSNDGENFELIAEVAINNSADLEYTIPETTCRYLKVEYSKWDTAQSMAVQVSEFRLGRLLN